MYIETLAAYISHVIMNLINCGLALLFCSIQAKQTFESVISYTATMGIMC